MDAPNKMLALYFSAVLPFQNSRPARQNRERFGMFRKFGTGLSPIFLSLWRLTNRATGLTPQRASRISFNIAG
jgi:hypothetical protein